MDQIFSAIANGINKFWEQGPLVSVLIITNFCTGGMSYLLFQRNSALVDKILTLIPDAIDRIKTITDAFEKETK